MSKWFIENYLGFNCPFLLRNIKKSQNKLNQKIDETPCSKFTIKKIDNNFNKVIIRAYIQNKSQFYPVDLDNKNFLYTFSCFDKIHFYFLVEKNKEVKMFYKDFECCSNFHINEIKAYEIGLFGKNKFFENGSDYLKIDVKIENLRINKYHYNIEKINKSEESFFNMYFYNKKYNINRYRCIFCLKTFEKVSFLMNHINYCHLYYNCTYNSEGFKIIKETNFNIDTNKKFFFKNINKNIYKNFKYKKITVNNKKIKVLDYPLSKFKIFIENEYENIDFNKTLRKYINKRFESYKYQNEEELKIMKMWNEIRTIENNPTAILFSVINNIGINENTLNLIVLLQNKGVLSSKEIMHVLNYYSESKKI